MLARVTAAEYVRPMTSGRTCPHIIICERLDGSPVTTVAKFSAFCDQKEVHLAREAIAACLAADLGLPIQEPFLVEIPPGWSTAVADLTTRARIDASSRVAFGSAMITGGFSVWTPDTHLTEAMIDVAAAVFCFDAIIQNPDRRHDNPNCLVRGEELRIFDHELAFAQRLIIGWRPPWAPGGLNWLERKGSHIFRGDLRRSGVEFAPIEERWKGVADARLAEYKAELPAEWNHVSGEVDSALGLIREARDKIAECIKEIQRVLS